MKHSFASWPALLRNNRASGSVVEACVRFERFSPWKSRSPLLPGAVGPPEPSFGRKLFSEAQASIRVPSTLKCSVDSRRLTLATMMPPIFLSLLEAYRACVLDEYELITMKGFDAATSDLLAQHLREALDDILTTLISRVRKERGQ